MRRASFFFSCLRQCICWSAFIGGLLTAGMVSIAAAQGPTNAGASGVTSAPVPTVSAEATPTDNRFQSPKIIEHPSPAYPILALLNRVEGVVEIRFGIDDRGRVTTVSLAKSAGSIMLDSLVYDPTLHDWTFEPAMLDGKPIASSIKREFEFRLDPEEQRKMAQERLAAPVGLPEPPYPTEALSRGRPSGSCTVGVVWTKDRGLVDQIYLNKSSGSNLLDRAAVLWVFTHWKVNPESIVYPKDKDGRDKPFTRTVTFAPPGPGVTP